MNMDLDGNWIRMFGTKFLEGLQGEDKIQQTLDAISDKLRPTMTLWDGSQWI